MMEQQEFQLHTIAAAADQTSIVAASASPPPLLQQQHPSVELQLPATQPVPKKRGIRKLLSFFGPGFLVSIAYIDPGNFETDLQGGAQHKYELLWVVFWSTVAALLIQSLAANLGIVTGKHLAEHCKAEYPRMVNYFLYVAAELSIVSSDVPEVLGTALALNLLFHLPVWMGVLLTGLNTLLFLALERYGERNLEITVSLLVMVMAVCFFVEVGYAKPAPNEVLKGLVIPRLAGDGAMALAISFVGSIVMPQNLFLHSALVLSRKTPRTTVAIKEARYFCFLESAIALFVTFLINLSIVSISGAICSNPNLTPTDQRKCDSLNLNEASFLLRNVLGRWSSKLFGILLIASGQSSTITGTYSGQFVMQGFIELRLTPWVRNILTRCVAIIPSLVAALLGGASGAGNLIIMSSMILSFELPFALLPLLKFTSNRTKMGSFKNHIMAIFVTWILGVGIMVANVYFLGTSLFQWLISQNGVEKVGVIFIGIIGFGAMLGYLIVIGYLVLRTENIVTHDLPSENVDKVEES